MNLQHTHTHQAHRRGVREGYLRNQPPLGASARLAASCWRSPSSYHSRELCQNLSKILRMVQGPASERKQKKGQDH